MILGREPALILGALQAALALGIGLGLIKLTPEQIALVLGAAAAVAALIVRQVVTPTNAPVLPAGTEVKVAGTNTTSTV
jgi:4-amino-4-deoxy-L-arabinose transferase-like glycosyltransferase